MPSSRAVEEVKRSSAPSAPAKKPREELKLASTATAADKKGSDKKTVRFEARETVPKREEARHMTKKVAPKERQCKMFQTKGFCKYGDKCFYSHAIPKI